MSEKHSKPVCWLCKARVGLVIEWILLDPTVVPPPAGIHVCGPDCPKQGKDAVIVRQDSILTSIPSSSNGADGKQLMLPEMVA